MIRQRFDLWPWISDLEGKNSKFRSHRKLHMVIFFISMHSYLNPIKIEGGVSKNAKNRPKRHPPLWPWPGDLDIGMVSWPCLGLPTRWIRWPNTVIKGVKWCVKGLTFDLEYLTLRAKTQNSALTDLCIWSFCTCLCISSLLGWKLYDKFEKMSNKNI